MSTSERGRKQSLKCIQLLRFPVSPRKRDWTCATDNHIAEVDKAVWKRIKPESTNPGMILWMKALLSTGCLFAHTDPVNSIKKSNRVKEFHKEKVSNRVKEFHKPLVFQYTAVRSALLVEFYQQTISWTVLEDPAKIQVVLTEYMDAIKWIPGLGHFSRQLSFWC